MIRHAAVWMVRLFFGRTDDVILGEGARSTGEIRAGDAIAGVG